MSKIDYKSLHEVNREVRAWQDGNAEFDYSICGELKLEDKCGNIVFVHATYMGSYDHLIYLVSKYSAFDKEHFDEPDYEIQHFEGDIKKCAKSQYYPYLKIADDIVDKKFRDILAELDDTKNFPNGRMCSVNGGLYYEMYIEPLNKYFQIRQSSHDDNLTFRYTVTNESNYMREYMNFMYPSYYPQKQHKIEVLLDTTDLNDLAWDDPYLYAFTQISGIYELHNRRTVFAETRYSSEEKIAYDTFIPYYLRVATQQADNQGHKGAVITEVGFLGPENQKMSLYIAKFDSDKTEFVYIPPHAEGERDTAKDYIYVDDEVAVKSEWAEYFELLSDLLKQRENGGADFVWRAGSPDITGVLHCKKHQLSEKTQFIWGEEISEGSFRNPELYKYGYDAEHPFIIFILDTENSGLEGASLLDKYLDLSSLTDIKIDPHDNQGRLVRRDDSYYHYMVTNGEFPETKKPVNEEDWMEDFIRSYKGNE